MVTHWLGVGSINLFGLPFAGKDTQARMLADLFGGVVIGGGDILRSHHDPAEIERVMAGGGLIPSDFFFNLVLPYFSKPAFKNKPLILDAVGRSEGEETVITKAAAASGHPLMAVVLLQLSVQEVWRRFDAAMRDHDRGQRTDDHRGVLQNRLEKFRTKTEPVIAFYRSKGLLIEVNGALPREAVTDEILHGLATRAAL